MKLRMNLQVAAAVIAIMAPSYALSSEWYVELAAQQFKLDDGRTKGKRTTDSMFAGSPLSIIAASEETPFRFDAQYDNGNAPSIKVGFRSRRQGPRAEFEYRQYKSDIRNFGNEDTGQFFTGSARSQQLLVNFWYDFHSLPLLPKYIVPYLGGGAGVGQLSLDGESANALVGQLGAGVYIQNLGELIDSDLLDRLAIGIGYRRFMSNDLTFDRINGDKLESTKYDGRTLELSIRYSFGDR